MKDDFPTTITPIVVYTVELEWDGPVGSDHLVIQSIRKAIEKLKIPNDVCYTDRGGCNGYSYFCAAGRNFSTVKDYSEKVLRILKRRKCRVEMY